MGERPDEIGRLDPVSGRLGDETYQPVDPHGDELGAEGETGAYSSDLTWNASDTVTDTTDTAFTDSGYTEADDDLEATRAQIEETRAGMSETIDAIQQKLSPHNLAEQAKDTVRDATIGKAEAAVNSASETAKGFGSGLLETVRQNPVPAALAGIGIGWLLTSGMKQGSGPRYYQTSRYPEGYQPRGYNTGNTYGDDRGGYTGGQESDTSSASGALNRVQDTVGNVSDQVQGAVGETVSQAQDMASRVADQVQGTASQVAGQVRNISLLDTIKENPVPAALVGLGLGWLYMSTRDQGSQQTYPYRSYSYGQTIAPNREYDYGYSGQASGSTAGQAIDRAQDAAGNLANQAQATAGQVASQAQNMAGQVQDQAVQIGSTAQYQAQQAATGFQQMLQEQPLAVGAAAVAVGLAVGLAVPETPQENQLFGPARDNLFDQAQQAAQRTAQKVQNVAQEAVGAAKDEAQNQGLA